MRMKLSLIVSTYNWPGALRLCLMSVARQTMMPYEVIVADDGSGEETRRLIDEMRAVLPCTLKHAWQADEGFRLAESRNNALRQCEGDYVVFVDGDIVLERHFVADHAAMAERGYFVVGSRSRIGERLTAELIERRSVKVSWLSRGVGQRLNAMYMPFLRRFTEGYKKRNRLYGRGCNMAAFMDDVRAVNGFDSALQGYGYEDTDFIARLVNLGLSRKFAKFRAIEFHLYHVEKEFAPDNEAIYKQGKGRVACERGIN